MSQPELDPSLPKERAEFLRFGQFDWLHATFVQHSFAPHTHDSYVIGWIERGLEAFAYQKTVHFAPVGSLMMVNPYEVHTGYAPLETGWTYRTIYPSLELMQQVSTQLGLKDLPIFRQAVIQNPRLEQQFSAMHRLQHSGSSLAAESTLLEVLGTFVQHFAQSHPLVKTPLEPSGIAKVRTLLEDNLGQNIRLRHLANIAQVPEFTLLKAFRRIHGLPPHAYVLQKRLEAAKAALRGRSGIANIAAELGFADQAHLTRTFKKTYGITPSVYRKGIGNFIQDTPALLG
jgi:AraC-like DNA-binding protein